MVNKLLAVQKKVGYKINKMDNTLRDSRFYDEADTRKAFSDLEDSKLLEYGKSFYRTSVNYVATCRSLSTGM